jgi:copper transport protein
MCKLIGLSLQRILALSAAAGIAATVLVGTTEPTHGHASLVGTEPATRSVVATAPKTLRLSFNEPVTPLVLKLVWAEAQGTFLTRYKLEGSLLVVEAPPDMQPGTHVLSWRVISADGHPIGGTIAFSIGASSPGAPPQPDEVYDPPARAAFWIVKLVIYLGLFVGVGGAFAGRWLAGRHTTHGFPSYIVRSALLVGLLAVPLSVGLQGLDALGAQLTQLTSPVVWQTGFNTSWGKTVVIAAIALVAGTCAIAIRRPPLARAFGLAGLIGIGLALAASGHASAASPQGLTAPAVALHALGVAFWTGSLLPLAAVMTKDIDRAVEALHRFSRIIPVVLAAIILSGAFLAVVQVERVEALWSTTYGRVLVAKLGVVAALLAIAACNRFVLTRQINRGQTRARFSLVRAILVELVLLTSAFGLVATWRFTPPPRAIAAAAAEPAVLAFHTASAFANIAFAPARAGRITVSMIVMTGNFEPLDAKAVTVTVANPLAGVEPIARSAYRPGDGSWRIEALTLPVPGLWSARVDVLMPDDTIVTLEDQLEIRP